jgi:hypothetical protein
MPLPQTEIPARLQALLAECGIPMTDQRGTVHFAPLMKLPRSRTQALLSLSVLFHSCSGLPVIGWR